MPKPDKTLADLLNEIGPVLAPADEDWLGGLAAATGQHRETIRNIRRGSLNTIGADHGVMIDLLAFVERRAKETAKTRDAVKAWMKKNREV
jgi:hypothetical protein